MPARNEAPALPNVLKDVPPEINQIDTRKSIWKAKKEKVKIQARRYQVKLNPQFDISTEELNKTKSGLVLVDTRSTLEVFKGKIPGSIHISWTDFYSGKDKRLLSADALKQLLQKHGIDLHKPIVYYCSGGIRSGYAWLVHQLAGLPDARNYEGGMEAWNRRPSK